MISPRRLSLVVLVLSAVLGLTTGVMVIVVVTRPAPTPGLTLEIPVTEPDGLRVLRAWDDLRSRAYAQADGAALARLYVAGSRAGAVDLAVLRGYRERGLRVTGMRTQVLSATVLRESERRIELSVTDVLIDAVATDGDQLRWSLPRDRPSTRRVVLVWSEGDWRVAEAYAED